MFVGRDAERRTVSLYRDATCPPPHPLCSDSNTSTCCRFVVDLFTTCRTGIQQIHEQVVQRIEAVEFGLVVDLLWRCSQSQQNKSTTLRQVHNLLYNQVLIVQNKFTTNGNTQFYLQTSHSCLYSPATEHHRPLAGTRFAIPRRVEG